MEITKREKIGLTVFTIILLCVISVMYFSHRDEKSIEVVKSSNNVQIDKSNTKEIKVYICGEVRKPGVYTLIEGDRVVKLIEMSGGFSEKADSNAINMAMKLKDEDFIKIPEKNLNLSVPSQLTKKESNEVRSNKIDSANLININTSTKDELMNLPGIGEALSQRIIDYREKNGFYKSIEEIKNVSGIGDKLFDKLKDEITI